VGLAPHAAAGYERVHTLRWMQPEGAAPTGFAMALGSTSGQYGETRDLGAVSAGADGLYRADVVLDAFQDYYVVVTAYNEVGSSPRSNEILVAKAVCDETFCEDGESCTRDACGSAGCSHQPLPDGTSCSGAGGPGLCIGGSCQAAECLAHADCGDGNACNGVEICVGNQCQPGTAPSCGGETACTVAGCDARLGCVTRNKPDGTTCSDGNAATTNDRCTAGVCSGTVPPPPDPEPTCDPAACEDGDPCTVNGCLQGACIARPAPNGTMCDDGDATTVADMCTDAVCAGTPPVSGPPVCGGLSCEDGNTCTADACTELGCTHVALADGTACDDGDRKTRGDRCSAGTCVGAEKSSKRGFWANGKYWEPGSRRRR